MRGHEKRVPSERIRPEVAFSGHLNGIANDKAPGRVDKRGGLGERLNDARLVVGSLQGEHDAARGIEQDFQRSEIEATVRRDGRCGHDWAKAMAGEHAGMLRGAGDQARGRAGPAAQAWRQQRVGSLGRAGGEDDLF